ncbi:MAG TPA: ORF6N domain-containing protein [Chitinophagaceae bacterium]|nr:ORF6N domain-containing protein [Chitinophagaceae bacterium]
MKPNIIQKKIVELRGQKVMLDFHLAEIYQVETKVLNQAVKRNMEKFPKDFMFQLTKKEFANLKSQFVTSSWGGTRKLPFVFTEHGVTMAGMVLKSKRAIKLSLVVVRAFIELRQFALQHKNFATQLKELREELYNRLGEHDAQLSAIYNAIENLLDEKTEKQKLEERRRIGFK